MVKLFLGKLFLHSITWIILTLHIHIYTIKGIGVRTMPSVNMCIRIDSELKNQAEDILSQLGMTMSGTINMFLTQIVREKAVPLNLSLSRQDRMALDDIIASRTERRNGFKGYDAEYVLREMDDILSVAEQNPKYGKVQSDTVDES